jgi:nicotinate-nucleotide--dimethylbenzimidazole phosphoribosyltransferase
MAERGCAPATAVTVGHGPSRDFMRATGEGPFRDPPRAPAMTAADAIAGLEAGVALAMSLSEGGQGLDVVALGALGVGSEVASAALLGALTGRAPVGLGDPGAEAAGATRAGAAPLELLAAFGGPETAVLAGLILGAASLDAALVLDGHATGAAALVACALAPAARGYLVAAHRGAFTLPAMLAYLTLAPLFEVGLGHGDGTGAAMALPLIQQVAALANAGYNEP